MAHTLPYDILVDIVAYSTPPTYAALCLTSRDLHRLVNPRLYSEPYAFLRAPRQMAQSLAFLDSILGNVSLGMHVRALRLLLDGSDATARRVPAALRAMPLLQHLDIACLRVVLNMYPLDTVGAIATLRHLDSIRFYRTTAFDLSLLLDRLPPMKRISCLCHDEPVSGLGRLLLRSVHTLEALDAHGSHDDLEKLLDQSWPRVAAPTRSRHMPSAPRLSRARLRSPATTDRPLGSQLGRVYASRSGVFPISRPAVSYRCVFTGSIGWFTRTKPWPSENQAGRRRRRVPRRAHLCHHVLLRHALPEILGS